MKRVGITECKLYFIKPVKTTTKEDEQWQKPGTTEVLSWGKGRISTWGQQKPQELSPGYCFLRLWATRRCGEKGNPSPDPIWMSSFQAPLQIRLVDCLCISQLASQFPSTRVSLPTQGFLFSFVCLSVCRLFVLASSILETIFRNALVASCLCLESPTKVDIDRLWKPRPSHPSPVTHDLP